ncbi:Smr/MutS family protein [Amorphus sp. 3PC139-8]|uniref:Smr/MutS family protein n=1 Tax=Amorphus sp. 3PC139-8 TaxID=2735676 RepID=UPI00345D9BBD
MATRRRGPSRRLSEEEQALWRKVAETVAPLDAKRAAAIRPKPETPAPEASDPALPSGARKVPSAGLPTAPVAKAPRHRAPHHLPAVDRRTLQRIARGAMAIDARLDLHGLRQQAAHRALKSFLMAAQARGDRIVLVITGKGSSGVADEAGVLKRQVPHWLEAADIRPLVVGLSTAHRTHGGAGALYIQIRRHRPADR